MGTVGQVTLPFNDNGFVMLPLYQRSARDVTALRKKVHNHVDEIFDSYMQYRPPEEPVDA